MAGFTAIIRSAIPLLLMLTLVLGVAYPLMVFAVAQGVFPHKANGSLIMRDGKVIGSELLGQPFENEWYFWGRMSATQPAYNAGASGASNYGPANMKLLDATFGRVRQLEASDARNNTPVPVDLVTASASGLDPHISLDAAQYQLARVAAARHISEEKLAELLDAHTESFMFGTLGQPYVNVLRLNLALDELAKQQSKK